MRAALPQVEERSATAIRWQAPICWWLAVTAFNVVTVLLKGVTTAQEAAVHWWATPDAEVPELTARWLLDGAHGLLIGAWHASDRGPLQALLLLWGARWSTNPVPAYFAGILINSVWVVGLWWFLRAVKIQEVRIRWTVLLTALTGSIWLNTVYPWPKLLAGACALGCAAAILYRRPVLAGVLAGLAILAHGAALFALVGLIPWAISRLGKRALLALLVLGAIYAPWFAFGKIVDPPGDRLIKWHLAGDVAGTDDRSALQEIENAYDHAGRDVIGYKVDNLRLALGDPIQYGTGPWTPNWDHDLLGVIREGQLTRLLWAPGILLLGLVFGWRRVPRTVWLMLAAWLAAFVLIEWGGNGASSAWLVSAPYCLVVGWVAVCALASPRWMLPLQAAVFIGIWLLAPSVV